MIFPSLEIFHNSTTTSISLEAYTKDPMVTSQILISTSKAWFSEIYPFIAPQIYFHNDLSRFRIKG